MIIADIWVGKLKGKRLLGRRKRRWKILKWFLEKCVLGVWINFIWLRTEATGGLL
jgi:hypothetical protein